MTYVISWAVTTLLFAILWAAQRVIKQRRIGQYKIGMTQLSLIELQHGCYQIAHEDPAFNDMAALIKGYIPAAQFVRRWMFIFPIGVVTNTINPLTWAYALIPSIIPYFLLEYFLLG